MEGVEEEEGKDDTDGSCVREDADVLLELEKTLHM